MKGGVGPPIWDEGMAIGKLRSGWIYAGLLGVAGVASALETGRLDLAFGSGNGYVPVITADSARFHAVARLANRVIAGGSQGNQGLLVQRYDDGRADPTFWTTGQKVLDEVGEVRAIATLPNFDIVVAGWRDNGAGQHQAVLARYNSSGYLVTSFGVNGVAMLPFGNTSEFLDLRFANDRLTAVGTVDGSFLAARFQTNGDLDTGFATTGYRADLDGATGGDLRAVHVLADGSMMAVGFATTFASVAIRYEADGDPDLLFGGDGIVSFTTGTALTQAEAVTPGPGNSWWIGGTAYNATEALADQFIARLTATGVLDTGFAGGQGHVNLTSTYHLDDRGYTLALSPDGKPTLAGMSQRPDGRFVASLVRINTTSGALDVGFGDGGRVEVLGMSDADIENDIRDLRIDPDGTILAAGAMALSPGQFVPQLIQRQANGLPDSVFHADAGHAFVAPENGTFESGRSLRVRVAPDGGIVVAGFVYAQPHVELQLSRFDATGRVDTTFAGGAGFLRRSYPGGGLPLVPRDLLVRPDGRIVVAADAETGVADGNVIVYQFLANGNPDAAFGINGRIVLAVSGDNDIALGLALQPDGRLLIQGRTLGATNWTYWLARLQANGTLDPTFFPSASVPGIGILRVDSPGLGGAMALLSTGRILVTDGAGNLLRRLGDGSADASFAGTGTVVLPNPSQFSPTTMAVDGPGRIVIGGSVQNAGNFNDQIVRLLASGSPDLAFGSSGVVTRDEDATDGINALLIQRNGRILTAGKNYIANVSRYAPDGSQDTSFAPNGRIAFDGRGVQGLALDAQGGILATRQVIGSGGDHLGVARIGGDVPLTVNVVGQGTILSQPNFIHCGLTCTSDFATGETVIVQAQAAPGWVFMGWNGLAACGAGETCTFVKWETPETLTATFRSDALFKDSFD